VKAGFQPVIGATSLMGSRPTASELTTTAGRCFWISAPRVGLKSTSQTSPRLGNTWGTLGGGSLVLDKVAPFHVPPLSILSIVLCQLLGLFSQEPPTFFQRELHKCPAFDDR